MIFSTLPEGSNCWYNCSNCIGYKLVAAQQENSVSKFDARSLAGRFRFWRWMMSKVTEQIGLKLQLEERRQIQSIAQQHEETFNLTLRRLLRKGLAEYGLGADLPRLVGHRRKQKEPSKSIQPA